MSTNAMETGTSDALVAVGMGSGGIVKLYDLNARSKGCVIQCTLPTASGSVESCSFVQSYCQQNVEETGASSNPSSTQSSPPGSPPSLPQRGSETSRASSGSATTAFGEFGLAAGGQNGEVAFWDIRYPKRCLLQLTHEKSAVVQIRLLSDPFSQSERTVTMVVGHSDGRVLLYRMGPGLWFTETEQPDTNGRSPVQWSTLELTGINCEPVRGLSTVVKSDKTRGLCVWTASRSGVFRFYGPLASRRAFE
ncbi:unnamed protein product [Echinostoma caproni]|uniref:WD_REPEATS_REGION domain-containing protein n=1 Tax=Echinostoma caproni TaxID=27848 RepID=A0A183AXU7_9TREM|nr:unnamed protein product [Echinostoma caproni]